MKGKKLKIFLSLILVILIIAVTLFLISMVEVHTGVVEKIDENRVIFKTFNGYGGLNVSKNAELLDDYHQVVDNTKLRKGDNVHIIDNDVYGGVLNLLINYVYKDYFDTSYEKWSYYEVPIEKVDISNIEPGDNIKVFSIKEIDELGLGYSVKPIRNIIKVKKIK